MHHVLIRLLGFLKPYKGRVLLAALSILGATAFSLVQPQLIRWAVDMSIQRDQDKRLLIVAAAALLGAAALRGLFQFLQSYIGEWLSQHVAFDIRNDIYDRLQRLSYAYHDKSQVGQVMSRATQDVEGVRFYFSMGLLRLVAVFTLLVVSLILMAQTNLRLALVSWTFLPVIAVVSIVSQARMRPVWTRIQDQQGRMSTVLQENLSGMRVVKSFAREAFEATKFWKEIQALFDDSYLNNRTMAKVSPVMTALSTLATVVTVWYGGHLVGDGAITVGDLASFIFYLALMSMPVRSLGFVVNIIARATSSGTRIYEILDAESAVKEKPGATELHATGHVRFNDVSFGYDSISPVLRNITIEAQPGEMIALLGPTGSGKSTIVNLMPRFYDTTGGTITIDGVDIRDVTLTSLRRNIGIVQQDVFLFLESIRENIRYGRPEASDEEVIQAAKVARIHDFIMSLPDGYDTWVGERGTTLSGGQKQRIAIARTLLLDPPILVFDDSTSSVDMETEYLIQQALSELMKGRTTFVIAQRLRTVERADQIIVMRRGQVVERGRHEELLTKNGLYRQIYDIELKDQEDAFRKETTPVAGGS